MGYFRGLEQSFVLGMVGFLQVTHPVDADKLLVLLEQDAISRRNVFPLLLSLDADDERRKNPLLRGYAHFFVRSFVIELYEICKNSPIFAKIKSHDRFAFLANLRHAFAHGAQGEWRICRYGKKTVHYSRQIDFQTFVLDEARDRHPVFFEQFGGLATMRDLLRYAKNFFEPTKNPEKTISKKMGKKTLGKNTKK